MSDETTAAVERAADAIDPNGAWSDGLRRLRAREGLTAALTDPDDPDSLARTLYVIHESGIGWGADDCLRMWADYGDVRVHWRAVADGLRTAILGSD